MTVFLAWADAAVDPHLSGPWESIHTVGDGVILIDSKDTLSRVYHELKWSLPDHAALIVAPVSSRPKLARVASGTLTWLRARLP